MQMYKYNMSSLFIDFLGYGISNKVIGMLGILTVAPMTIIGILIHDYNEALALAMVLPSLLNLLVSMPMCYSDSVGIKLLSPYVLASLIIIFMLDTVIFVLWLSILGLYIPIRWVASVIYDIYDSIAEAKNVRDKAKADKLKAEEDHINKFRMDLFHEING